MHPSQHELRTNTYFPYWWLRIIRYYSDDYITHIRINKNHYHPLMAYTISEKVIMTTTAKITAIAVMAIAKPIAVLRTFVISSSTYLPTMICNSSLLYRKVNSR